MALNFPNSPTNGQIYTDTLSGNSWTFDSANTCWKSTSTYIQTITVSSTAPGTPAVGQLWWNRDYGRLLVYYSDGDTSQWVDASPSDYTSQLAYNQANAVSIVANNAFANTSGTFNGNLTISGNVIANKQVTVTYTPATSVNAAITLAAANTQGGTGYADFMKVTNLSGGATNSNKTFRLSSSGDVQTINNAYTAIIQNLTDSGYGTLPFQPNFRVEYTSGVSISNQVIVWNSVLVNDGSCYSNSTGRFTAPVTGKYLFSVTLLAGSPTNWGLFYFRVNGTKVAPNSGQFQMQGGSSDRSLTATPIIKMNASDYLDVYVDSGYGNFYTSGYNSFSGILLS